MTRMTYPRKVRVRFTDGRVGEGREGDTLNAIAGLDPAHRPPLTWHQVALAEYLQEDGGWCPYGGTEHHPRSSQAEALVAGAPKERQS